MCVCVRAQVDAQSCHSSSHNIMRAKGKRRREQRQWECKAGSGSASSEHYKTEEKKRGLAKSIHRERERERERILGLFGEGGKARGEGNSYFVCACVRMRERERERECTPNSEVGKGINEVEPKIDLVWKASGSSIHENEHVLLPLLFGSGREFCGSSSSKEREREREREGKKERKRGEGETTLSEYGIIGFLFSFLEEKKRAVGTGLEHGSIKLATNRLCGEVFSRRGCRATSVSSAE